jgi:hypothetical protein
MSDFDEKLILRSKARVSAYKKHLERSDLGDIMRKSYTESIAEEEKFIQHLESRRRPNTLAKD